MCACYRARNRVLLALALHCKNKRTNARIKRKTKAAEINMETTKTKAEAKEAFKRVLIEHKGEGSHPDVQLALDDLVRLAAEERGEGGEWSPASSAEPNGGRWRSITTPPFPGKLPEEDEAGRTRFTLGRMSFGLFKPKAMVCAVEDILNIVEPVDEKEAEDAASGNKAGDAPAWTQTYTIEVLMDIETPEAKLPARLVNYGTCFPTSPTRLGVKFTEGTLQPRFDMSDKANAALATAWKETFGNAISKEAEAQSYLGQLGTWAMHKLMNMMMGLEPPVDTADYTQTYSIGRPYVGHLDVLYLDEDFRITKGNKGTIVVVEKMAEEKK